MTVGCFKRFRFKECFGCTRQTPLHRLWCLIRYLTWHTDPIPVEMLLGRISLGWVATTLYQGVMSAEHFRVLWRTIPSVFWVSSMLGTASVQLGTQAWGRVGWVRLLRLCNSFYTAFLWTTMAIVTTTTLGFIQFSWACVVYSAAAWWVFLRTGDSRPGSCREHPQCRGPL